MYRRGGNRALAFAGIHEQQFALPHFYGIDNLQSFALAAQIAFRLFFDRSALVQPRLIVCQEPYFYRDGVFTTRTYVGQRRQVCLGMLFYFYLFIY
jgi:hypothetical protein